MYECRDSRKDGQFFYEINAINVPGFNLNGEIRKIQQWMNESGFEDPRMDITFGGLTERGAEATDFLIQAFRKIKSKNL